MSDLLTAHLTALRTFDRWDAATRPLKVCTWEKTIAAQREYWLGLFNGDVLALREHLIRYLGKKPSEVVRSWPYRAGAR